MLSLDRIKELISQGHHAIELELPFAEVTLIPQFIEQEEAEAYYKKLYDEIQWSQGEVTNGVKKVLAPRLEAWYGDAGRGYTYKNFLRRSLPWTPTLSEIKQKVEQELKLE